MAFRTTPLNRMAYRLGGVGGLDLFPDSALAPGLGTPWVALIPSRGCCFGVGVPKIQFRMTSLRLHDLRPLAEFARLAAKR